MMSEIRDSKLTNKYCPEEKKHVSNPKFRAAILGRRGVTLQKKDYKGKKNPVDFWRWKAQVIVNINNEDDQIEDQTRTPR